MLGCGFALVSCEGGEDEPPIHAVIKNEKCFFYA